MLERFFSYSVEADVPPGYMEGLSNYFYREYLLADGEEFSNVSRKREGQVPLLTYTVVTPEKRPMLDVEVRFSKPVSVKITRLYDAVPEEIVDIARQDVVIVVNLYEEQVRQRTIFFAWSEGKEIIPEEIKFTEKKPLNRMFMETQILLFVVLIGLGMFLFLFIGWLAPLILLTAQFILVVYSTRFVEGMADWHITEDEPYIHLLEYTLPAEDSGAGIGLTGEALLQLKREIYQETISRRGELDCESARQILRKHGLECRPGDLETKKVDVYQLVKSTADKFGFPTPKIIISNTIIPNAAASGPSPSRGVVLITTGLLVELEEDEIVSVLGHEFGHLKGRDPLILFSLTGAEFLFRFYALSYLFPSIFFSYFFFLYFFGVMTLIYFIAKFFETRADLVSAIVIGQPRVLAEGLEKIGFKRLLYERVPQYRVQEWLNLDPHPPIYFRVDRLEHLETPINVPHPLIQSAKDVVNGFLASLGWTRQSSST